MRKGPARNANPSSAALAATRLSDDRLRRVFAEGWVAGARNDIDAADAAAIGTLNPCTTPAERRQWRAAFTAAAARRIAAGSAR